ncbi:uncharacterized protein LOC126976715 [Leptidea sinapis]|uniref:uncharacterized protein LOC126976715 n=1 Tax=Leptidea sinapis TaxID=189913 RepID=UPI0021C3DEFB|nr:uncharacterized protein LOC126976715 [Leptidea sinapis]
MSHCVSRKSKPIDVSRAPVSLEASGDRDTDKKHRSKNRNKIPKELRNDLENALVNLCDIWFEEIKPTLVRNNIKLHWNEDKPSGDGNPLAGGLESEAGCTHLDPASTVDKCALCRLLFNAANSIESAVSQAAAAPKCASSPSIGFIAEQKKRMHMLQNNPYGDELPSMMNLLSINKTSPKHKIKPWK